MKRTGRGCCLLLPLLSLACLTGTRAALPDVVNALSGLPLGSGANAAVCAAEQLPSGAPDRSTALSQRCGDALAALAGSGDAQPGRPGWTNSSGYSHSSSSSEVAATSPAPAPSPVGAVTSSTAYAPSVAPSSSTDATVNAFNDFIRRLLIQGEAEAAKVALTDVCDPGNDLSTVSCADELTAASDAYFKGLATAHTSAFAPASACPAVTTGSAGARGSAGAVRMLVTGLCSRGSAASSAPSPSQPYCVVSVALALNSSGVLESLLEQVTTPGAVPLNATDAKRVCPALAATGCCAPGLLLTLQRSAALTCSPQASQMASAISLLKIACALAGSPLATTACDDVVAAVSAAPPAPSASQCATLIGLDKPLDSPVCSLSVGDCPTSGCDLFCAPPALPMPVAYEEDRPGDVPSETVSDNVTAETSAFSSSTEENDNERSATAPAATRRTARHGGVAAAVAIALIVIVVALCFGVAFLGRHGRLHHISDSFRRLIHGGGSAESTGKKAQGEWYMPPATEHAGGFELVASEDDAGMHLLGKASDV